MQENINNDKKTIKLPILLALTLVGGILVGAGFFGGTRPVAESSKNYSKIKEILNVIERNYVDSVSTDSLVDYSISKMLEKLDPHTVYLPIEEATVASSELEGGFDGIGVEFNIFRDTVFVVSPLVGGPSEAVGIQGGDAIIKANDTNLTGKNLSSSLVFKTLRGKRGSEVKLLIKRRNNPKILNFTVKRDKIPSYSVDAAYMMSPEIGYIKINRFAETTYDEFSTQLKSLKKQGMSKLLIDLRGNGGGYMERATSILDELIAGDGVLVYTVGNNHKFDRKTFAGTKGEFENGKIAVLIDEGSASASEIVAGTLQDYDRATIIGRRSFGKGLVQQPIELADGSELRLTIARYYIPSGRSIQKPYAKGHIEDYEIEMLTRERSGELYYADSIKNDNKKIYKTKAGRKVYGGGGITPDVFVKKDTSFYTNYLAELFGNSVIREFTTDYVATNKQRFESMSFEQYQKTFNVSSEMIGSLVQMAIKAGVKPNAKELARSENYLKRILKAQIARQIWRKNEKSGLSNEYHKIIAQEDEAVKKALETLK